MRHYLNTDLKGKKDIFGLQKYSVYVMFTVNRQTFKIKSQILRRMFSAEEFSQLYSDENAFINKDREIIRYCIEHSMQNQILNITHFKSIYAKCCTSITTWLDDSIQKRKTSSMDDFFYGTGLPDNNAELRALKSIERKYAISADVVRSYLLRFTNYMANEVTFDKYTLVYEWLNNDLRNKFQLFLNKQKIPPEHANIVPFIDEQINLM